MSAGRIDACRKELGNGDGLVLNRKYPLDVDQGKLRRDVAAGQNGKGYEGARPYQERAAAKPGVRPHRRYLQIGEVRRLEGNNEATFKLIVWEFVAER
jgi:hypothetical protein